MNPAGGAVCPFSMEEYLLPDLEEIQRGKNRSQACPRIGNGRKGQREVGLSNASGREKGMGESGVFEELQEAIGEMRQSALSSIIPDRAYTPQKGLASGGSTKKSGRSLRMGQATRSLPCGTASPRRGSARSSTKGSLKILRNSGDAAIIPKECYAYPPPL